MALLGLEPEGAAELGALLPLLQAHLIAQQRRQVRQLAEGALLLLDRSFLLNREVGARIARDIVGFELEMQLFFAGQVHRVLLDPRR